MNDQLVLFSTPQSDRWVFEQLHGVLLQVIEKNNLSPDKLIFEEGKNYSSVWYDSQMAFRICCRGDFHYFGVSDVFTSNANEIISQYVTKTGAVKGFTNYNFETSSEGVAVFADFLAAALDQAIDSKVKEFDCCSRYEECSNAKRCIHPNPDMALGCGYRKVMKRGRIFYGSNRNID